MPRLRRAEHQPQAVARHRENIIISWAALRTELVKYAIRKGIIQPYGSGPGGGLYREWEH
jgi:hypothetical protein